MKGGAWLMWVRDDEKIYKPTCFVDGIYSKEDMDRIWSAIRIGRDFIDLRKESGDAKK